VNWRGGTVYASPAAGSAGRRTGGRDQRDALPDGGRQRGQAGIAQLGVGMSWSRRTCGWTWSTLPVGLTASPRADTAMTGNVQAEAGDGSARRPGVSLRLLRKLPGEVPDHSSVWLRRGEDREVVTLGELRAVTAELPDDIPVEVAIRDRLHFKRSATSPLPVSPAAADRPPAAGSPLGRLVVGTASGRRAVNIHVLHGSCR
jgi:hypothetical protein